MIPSTNKIFKAINSYKIIENIDLGVYDIIDKNLSAETKQKVELSDINLHALAIIIKMVMSEINSYSEIDRLFNEKINDRNLVTELMMKYKN